MKYCKDLEIGNRFNPAQVFNTVDRYTDIDCLFNTVMVPRHETKTCLLLLNCYILYISLY